MNSYYSALLIAASAGAAMALQGSLNSVLSKETGLLEATLIVHLIGLAFLGILFALQLNSGNLFDAGKAPPWYSFLGGILGVAIVYGVVVAIPASGGWPAPPPPLSSARLPPPCSLIILDYSACNPSLLTGTSWLGSCPSPGRYLVLGGKVVSAKVQILDHLLFASFVHDVVIDTVNIGSLAGKITALHGIKVDAEQFLTKLRHFKRRDIGYEVIAQQIDEPGGYFGYIRGIE